MNLGKISARLSQILKKTTPTLFEQSLRPQHQPISRLCAALTVQKPGDQQRLKSGPKLFKPTQAQMASTAAANSCEMMEEDETITISRPCTIHDREKMIDFMSQLFVTREPLMRSLGATPQNSRKYIAYCIDEALEQESSFVAVDGIKGEICGLRVNTIGPSSGNELKMDFGSNINEIPKFLNYIENEMTNLLGTDRFMRHVAICVRPSSSQCGVATDLMRLSVEHAKKENIRYITAMCSWKLPFKLATKMGYKQAHQLSYEDYAKTQTFPTLQLQKAFLDLAASEGEARIMVKQLG